MIYFTADTHIGHANIIKYCNRPFKSIGEHDETLIKNWNETVTEGDEIYHLGDFAFASSDRVQRVTERLAGTKYFIRGNHDKKRKMPKEWTEVAPLYEIRVTDAELEADQRIIMCHYPIQSWNGKHHGTWHLHGHCHGTVPSEGIARLDVGVDIHNYKPISYEQVKILLTKRLLERGM